MTNFDKHLWANWNIAEGIPIIIATSEEALSRAQIDPALADKCTVVIFDEIDAPPCSIATLLESVKDNPNFNGIPNGYEDRNIEDTSILKAYRDGGTIVLDEL